MQESFDWSITDATWFWVILVDSYGARSQADLVRKRRFVSALGGAISFNVPPI